MSRAIGWKSLTKPIGAYISCHRSHTQLPLVAATNPIVATTPSACSSSRGHPLNTNAIHTSWGGVETIAILCPRATGGIRQTIGIMVIGCLLATVGILDKVDNLAPRPRCHLAMKKKSHSNKHNNGTYAIRRRNQEQTTPEAAIIIHENRCRPCPPQIRPHSTALASSRSPRTPSAAPQSRPKAMVWLAYGKSAQLPKSMARLAPGKSPPKTSQDLGRG